jgi:hypothetical protein
MEHTKLGHFCLQDKVDTIRLLVIGIDSHQKLELHP